jgi:hypothetical protein
VVGELRATDHGGSDSSRPATPDDHGGSGSHPAAAQNCGERQTAPPTSSHPWPAAERAPCGGGEAELPSDGNERPLQGNASSGSASVAPTSSAPRRWGARRTPACPAPQRTLGHGGGDPVPPTVQLSWRRGSGSRLVSATSAGRSLGRAPGRGGHAAGRPPPTPCASGERKRIKDK